MTDKIRKFPKAYTLTDREVAILKQASLDRALYNDSATLRQIICEWHEMTNKYPVEGHPAIPGR